MFAWLLAPLRALVSLDRWHEILDTAGRNALRSLLTAISVAWGVFMLIVLLGLGQGLENGMKRNFGSQAANSISIRASRTSVPFAGFDVGRQLAFSNRDIPKAQSVRGIDRFNAKFYIRGGVFGGSEMMVRRGTKANSFAIQSVYPDSMFIEQHQMVEGRFLNEADLAQRAKSAVVGRPVVKFLFGEEEDAVGQWIIVGGVPFQIVGVFRNDDGDDVERQIYIPVPTAQVAFNGADRINQLQFTIANATAAEAQRITSTIKSQLAEAHLFSVDDPMAVRVQDNVENAERFQKLFAMISLFVLVIGIGTILAGIVGVSNIMMIAVKERTKEIGIRKALGAKPVAIVSMIVQEAVVLTLAAGLAGLSVGIGTLALLATLFGPDAFIQNPIVPPTWGLAAIAVLVFFGAMAGLFPALAAASVNPIHSLRDS